MGNGCWVDCQQHLPHWHLSYYNFHSQTGSRDTEEGIQCHTQKYTCLITVNRCLKTKPGCLDTFISEWFLFASRAFVEMLIVTFASGFINKGHSLRLKSLIPAYSYILPLWVHWVFRQYRLPVRMQIRVFSGMFITHSKFEVELNGLLTDDPSNTNS